MFVVRRPFRDMEGMFNAGSIVEPAQIRNFKRRVIDKHIVEVNEHNFNEYAHFFMERYGVKLEKPKPASNVSVPVSEEPKQASSVKATPKVTPKVTVTTASVK